MAKQSLYATASTNPLESLPSLLNSGPLRDYQLNLAELRRQQAQLAASLTPGHYKMERLAAQISEVEKVLQKEWAKTLTLIRNDYETALKREKLLAEDWASQAQLVSEQSTKAVRYNVLKRQADSNQRLYDIMLQKLKEAALVSALSTTNIQVVDLPIQPSFPHRPQLLVNSGIGLLTGAALGLLLGFIRMRSEQQFVTPASADAYFPVRELGVIPNANADPGDAFLSKRETLHLRPNEQVELVTWQRKPSLLAESFRATLFSLLRTPPNGDCSRISHSDGNRSRMSTVTSPGSKEGKTTVTSNLGIALVETGRRVLLIDADLRAPRLSAVFEVPNNWGLSDILLGNHVIDGVPLESLVKTTAVPGLFLLPSGPLVPNVSSLFHSTYLCKLLTRFRNEFDAVLIDAPPVGIFPDARLVGQHTDGVILVTRSHRTSLHSYHSACETLVQDRIRLLGTIINDWNPKRSGVNIKDYYSDYYHK
jgi:capsular exopolysaccharide synthesis family protein